MSPGDHLLIQGEVVGDHSSGGEPLDDGGAAGVTTELVDAMDRGHQFRGIRAEDPRTAGFHDLRCGAVGTGDYRRPACHRFDHHEAERFGPSDRIPPSLGSTEERQLRGTGDFPHDVNIVGKQRHDLLSEISLFGWFSVLGGEHQWLPSGTWCYYGFAYPLVRGHPPKKEQVAAVASAHRVFVGVQAVVNDAIYGDLRRVRGLIV